MTTQPDLIVNVPIEDILSNIHQPRQTFDDASLAELAASIKEHGVIQPLIIYRNTGEECDVYHFRLIAGERRLRAAQLAGLIDVPCLIRETAPDTQTEFEMALIENIQRENLSPADEARAYQRLHDEFGLTDEQIAQRVGKARSTVANARRLVELPAAVLDQVGDGENALPLRYARALISIARIDEQAATNIAATVVAAGEDDDREDDFEDSVSTLLRKKGVDLRDVTFDQKWQPGKTEYEIDGVLQPLPACVGCEAHLKFDYKEWCARPACCTIKQQIWIEKELRRVSKAMGIAIAAKGEKTHPLPKEAGEWQHTKTYQKLAETKHESLRLVAAGTGTTGRWENEHVTGSDDVRLVTTDPEALAKAAGLKIEKPDEPGKPQKTWQELQAERQARHEVAVTALAETFKIVAPLVAKVLPDNRNLLFRFFDMWDGNRGDVPLPKDLDTRLNTKKGVLPALDDLKLALAYSLMNANIDLAYEQPRAIVARDPLDELARDLKVKLPAGWDDPLKMKPAKPVEAKKQAKTKPAAKKGAK